MNAWTADQFDRIADADELQVSSQRADGSLPPFKTIWVVRVGDELYVRSAYGPDSGWFSRATSSRAGRIKAGGVVRDVAFTSVPADDAELHDALDAAYSQKYSNYSEDVLGTVLGPPAREVTLRLDPLD